MSKISGYCTADQIEKICAESFPRGFLPVSDPARRFSQHTELSMLDELGSDLPSLLQHSGFRKFARSLNIPRWKANIVDQRDLAELRLYYVRVGFLASAYINQLGEPPVSVLPSNIAVPLCTACALLKRPPILSYDGYALYNWRRFDPNGPIALGNIDTIQNFVHLYDERWFILVHVEIEAIAADIIKAIDNIAMALRQQEHALIDSAVTQIMRAVNRQVAVLKRIPEKMDPAIYYKTFRRYIRYFENVIYEGVKQVSVDYRGETGAQSSVIPVLVALMKIEHRRSMLTDHLQDMRRYMPEQHRAMIERVERIPDIRKFCNKSSYNGVLEAIAAFRDVHYQWAQQYINRWTDDPHGTGGTPYMEWLKLLIDETRAHMV